MEGMSFGKPLIAVNQGSPSECTLHAKTGFLVKPTAYAFAGAMKELASNENLVLTMGKAARKRAEEYDWTIVSRRIDEYIDSLS